MGDTKAIMTRSPYEEIPDDGINIHCVICGSQIHAGRYPPTCDGYCRDEWDLECEFNRRIRDENKR